MRMLWVRSASLMRMTRISCTIAIIILRKFRLALFLVAEVQLISLTLLPPVRQRFCQTAVPYPRKWQGVSSITSCSRAAIKVFIASSFISARMQATATGCVI